MKVAGAKIDDKTWRLIASRSKKADGDFVYAVLTTMIYCRPSCGSRHAKRENMRIYSHSTDAELDGYRPCKRCQPDTTLENEIELKIARACQFIHQSEIEPCLAEIAASAQLSPYHFHRQFKAHMGITPKAYFKAFRAGRLRQELKTSSTITSAIYDAGYGSNSRFYEQSDQVLGMTPGVYKKGGEAMMIYFAVGVWSLGHILVAQTQKGICSILLGDEAEQLINELEDEFPNAELIGGDKSFETVVAQVVAFVEQPGTKFNLPLDIQGTAFQQKVWQALREIPLGTTISYSELAQKIGQPSAVRAAATACARNKIAIAIPCHRVVRQNGDLSGYRWGIERKRSVLSSEQKS